MSSESKTTIDHDTIRHWAEQRGGVPALLARTENKEKGAGILRIHFPGYSPESEFDEISWEQFFNEFENNRLAMLYQEETQDGKESRFSKFIDRD